MQDLQRPTLVVFDMDGTMLDTEPLSMAGWQAAIKDQQLDVSTELFETTFNSIIGTNGKNCERVICANIPGFNYKRGGDFALKYMYDYMNENGVPLKPGIVQLLEFLEGEGIKKCVATSSRKERAKHYLSLANILHHFDVVVGGDEIENSKPAPDIFLEAARRCGVDPTSCLVLEDSAAGAEGGYRAGMQVIVIPDILAPSEKTRSMAVAVCEDLFAVTALLSNLTK